MIRERRRAARSSPASRRICSLFERRQDSRVSSRGRCIAIVSPWRFRDVDDGACSRERESHTCDKSSESSLDRDSSRERERVSTSLEPQRNYLKNRRDVSRSRERSADVDLGPTLKRPNGILQRTWGASGTARSPRPFSCCLPPPTGKIWTRVSWKENGLSRRPKALSRTVSRKNLPDFQHTLSRRKSADAAQRGSRSSASAAACVFRGKILNATQSRWTILNGASSVGKIGARDIPRDAPERAPRKGLAHLLSRRHPEKKDLFVRVERRRSLAGRPSPKPPLASTCVFFFFVSSFVRVSFSSVSFFFRLSFLIFEKNFAKVPRGARRARARVTFFRPKRPTAQEREKKTPTVGSRGLVLDALIFGGRLRVALRIRIEKGGLGDSVKSVRARPTKGSRSQQVLTQRHLATRSNGRIGQKRSKRVGQATPSRD